MDVAYRIRHRPTGLYFCPSGNSYTKHNLSRNGKLYINRRPNLGYLGNKVYLDANVLTDVVLEDWEIVTYDLVERTNVS